MDEWFHKCYIKVKKWLKGCYSCKCYIFIFLHKCSSCFSYIASIIDTGSGFRLQRNRLFHRSKKLDKNKEIIWTNKNGIVTDDEESQIDLITVYGNKMIARFPDVEPKQNAFLIGYYDSKNPVKLIADVRLNHTLKFTFDL